MTILILFASPIFILLFISCRKSLGIFFPVGNVRWVSDYSVADAVECEVALRWNLSLTDLVKPVSLCFILENRERIIQVETKNLKQL